MREKERAGAAAEYGPAREGAELALAEYGGVSEPGRALRHPEDREWLEVSPECPLGEIAAAEGYVCVGGQVAVIVYPRGGKAHAKFLRDLGERLGKQVIGKDGECVYHRLFAGD